MASGGAADRIIFRTLFKVLRAGSRTPARYSSTLFGTRLPFATEPRSPEFVFFIWVTPHENSLQVCLSDAGLFIRHRERLYAAAVCAFVYGGGFGRPFDRLAIRAYLH